MRIIHVVYESIIDHVMTIQPSNEFGNCSFSDRFFFFAKRFSQVASRYKSGPPIRPVVNSAEVVCILNLGPSKWLLMLSTRKNIRNASQQCTHNGRSDQKPPTCPKCRHTVIYNYTHRPYFNNINKGGHYRMELITRTVVLYSMYTIQICHLV